MLKKEQVIELQRWCDLVGLPKEARDEEISQLGMASHKRFPRANRRLQREWLNKFLCIIERLRKLVNKAPIGLIEEIIEMGLDRNQKVVRSHQLDDWSIWFAYFLLAFLPKNFDQNMERLKVHINELVARKKVSDEKLTNDYLAWYCGVLERKYDLNINQEKVIHFICACTGKERETVKKQIQRFGLSEYDNGQSDEILLVSDGCWARGLLAFIKGDVDRMLSRVVYQSPHSYIFSQK